MTEEENINTKFIRNDRIGRFLLEIVSQKKEPYTEDMVGFYGGIGGGILIGVIYGIFMGVITILKYKNF